MYTLFILMIFRHHELLVSHFMKKDGPSTPLLTGTHSKILFIECELPRQCTKHTARLVSPFFLSQYGSWRLLLEQYVCFLLQCTLEGLNISTAHLCRVSSEESVCWCFSTRVQSIVSESELRLLVCNLFLIWELKLYSSQSRGGNGKRSTQAMKDAGWDSFLFCPGKSLWSHGEVPKHICRSSGL